VPVRKHPTKQTQDRSLAPAVRRTPARDRPHTLDEATNDGEEEIDRTESDEQSFQLRHGDFILIPHDRHRNWLVHGIQLHRHAAAAIKFPPKLRMDPRVEMRWTPSASTLPVAPGRRNRGECGRITATRLDGVPIQSVDL
jgi:hypothetical protein